MNKDSNQDPKLHKIEVTMQEIWQATRPVVHTSKKSYSRKKKHKKSDDRLDS
jgi:hypothetical protein